MKLLVIFTLFIGFSYLADAQYDRFCFGVNGEYKFYESSIQVDSISYNFKGFGSSSLFGLGFKRSIGYVDNLLNIGVIVQYGSGDYYGETKGVDKFRNYHVGAILDYEKSIGLRSTAHPYSTYPIANIGVNYLWQALEFKSLNRSIGEVNQTFFKANNPRVLIGGGVRMYSKKEYKGTLKVNFYYDIPSNKWTSSRDEFTIKTIDSYGIRLSYSVSN